MKSFIARLLRSQNPFTIVGGIWLIVSFVGCLPLYFSGFFPSFTDAFFESVSGFTTTGATILPGVEQLPHWVNFWRCLTHWLGGMGVIALAVALVPILGEDGYRLIRAETSGPEKGKLTSRISDSAKVLWLIYAVLTLLQFGALCWAGLSPFDAICHAFSTMGTGGFSTRNDSVYAFLNPAAEWICTVFMLLASVNFGCYYLLLCGKLRELRSSTELRGFLWIVAVASVVIIIVNAPLYATFDENVRHAVFQVASVISTTGFMTVDYTVWHPAAQFVLLLLFVIGGCSGSTAGGVKVIRWAVLAKQLRNEVLKLLHPRDVITLRIDGQPGREFMVPLVGCFIFVYMVLVCVTAFMGALVGMDILTAFTAALTMVGNVGPAFGSLGPAENYGMLPAALKWWYCFAMLAGRLEVYTLLIMMTNWRKK